MLDGRYTRSCGYRFIHSARLVVVLLNETCRFNTEDKRCRRSRYTRETLPHVLNLCREYLAAWQVTMMASCKELARLQKQDMASLSLGKWTTQRPVLIMAGRATQKIIIIDVWVSFEGSSSALKIACQQNIDKYKHYADEMRQLGWNVHLDGFVIVSLGS